MPDSHPRLRAALSAYRPRNGRFADVWSLVHVGVCASMTFLFGPFVAFALSVAWEPLEVLVLSPLLAKRGIDFGHESLRNSLADVAFNALGCGLGWLALSWVPWAPPLAWP